ncbi:MAG: radical SAM protein [bacterium]
MKINEMFLSIQGEGIQSGLPTFFIRTTGCNLRCSYCDTKYAYYKGKEMSIKEILNKVQNQPYKRICLTGGEPLLQSDAKILINELIKKGYSIDIETNGSISLKSFPKSKLILYSMDIKCPSSKETKKMIFNNISFLNKKDQIKFIIKTKEDYNFAREIIKKYKLIDKINIIFQPVGGIKAKWMVEKILSDRLNARIGLQIHKVIWKTNKKGV